MTKLMMTGKAMDENIEMTMDGMANDMTFGFALRIDITLGSIFFSSSLVTMYELDSFVFSPNNLACPIVRPDLFKFLN